MWHLRPNSVPKTGWWTMQLRGLEAGKHWEEPRNAASLIFLISGRETKAQGLAKVLANPRQQPSKPRAFSNAMKEGCLVLGRRCLLRQLWRSRRWWTLFFNSWSCRCSKGKRVLQVWLLHQDVRELLRAGPESCSQLCPQNATQGQVHWGCSVNEQINNNVNERD